MVCSARVLDKRSEILAISLLHGARNVRVFGSAARDDARPDSDVDLLVLLNGPVDLGSDLEQIIAALYPLQLEWERPIHAMPVDHEVYLQGQFALYRNAQKEGILL